MTFANNVHQWSVDSISLNGKTLFISGWFFSSYHDCSEVWLDLTAYDQRLIESMRLNAGNPRQDVAMIHSDEQHALYSGFTGLGAWASTPSSTDEMRLRCILADSSQHLLIIPRERWLVIDLKPTHLAKFRIRLAHLRHYGLKAAALVTRGQLGVYAIKSYANLVTSHQLRFRKLISWLN